MLTFQITRAFMPNLAYLQCRLPHCSRHTHADHHLLERIVPVCADHLRLLAGRMGSDRELRLGCITTLSHETLTTGVFADFWRRPRSQSPQPNSLTDPAL